MEQIFGEIWPRFETFLVILVRMMGLFLMSPIFGRQNVPAYSKIGLSLILSYMVLSNKYFTPDIEVWSYYELGLIILKEILVGFVIGFITTLVFSAIWTAGQIIDTQIGFGIVNVIDPQNSIQIPLMGNFKNILALLAFFTVDGHHTLIRLIFSTYNIIPLGKGMITQNVSSLAIEFFANSFLLALKIALPIVAVTFLSEIAFGVLVRVVPQMNIFIIGIPIKIFVGLIAILIFIPIYIYSLNGIFDGMFSDIGKALLRMVGR